MTLTEMQAIIHEENEIFTRKSWVLTDNQQLLRFLIAGWDRTEDIKEIEKDTALYAILSTFGGTKVVNTRVIDLVEVMPDGNAIYTPNWRPEAEDLTADDYLPILMLPDGLNYNEAPPHIQKLIDDEIAKDETRSINPEQDSALFTEE